VQFYRYRKFCKCLSDLFLPHLSKCIFMTTVEVEINLCPADVKQLKIIIVQSDESHNCQQCTSPLDFMQTASNSSLLNCSMKQIHRIKQSTSVLRYSTTIAQIHKCFNHTLIVLTKVNFCTNTSFSILIPSIHTLSQCEMTNRKSRELYWLAPLLITVTTVNMDDVQNHFGH